MSIEKRIYLFLGILTVAIIVLGSVWTSYDAAEREKELARGLPAEQVKLNQPLKDGQVVNILTVGDLAKYPPCKWKNGPVCPTPTATSTPYVAPTNAPSPTINATETISATLAQAEALRLSQTTEAQRAKILAPVITPTKPPTPTAVPTNTPLPTPTFTNTPVPTPFPAEKTAQAFATLEKYPKTPTSAEKEAREAGNVAWETKVAEAKTYLGDFGKNAVAVVLTLVGLVFLIAVCVGVANNAKDILDYIKYGVYAVIGMIVIALAPISFPGIMIALVKKNIKGDAGNVAALLIAGCWAVLYVVIGYQVFFK